MEWGCSGNRGSVLWLSFYVLWSHHAGIRKPSSWWQAGKWLPALTQHVSLVPETAWAVYKGTGTSVYRGFRNLILSDFQCSVFEALDKMPLPKACWRPDQNSGQCLYVWTQSQCGADWPGCGCNLSSLLCDWSSLRSPIDLPVISAKHRNNLVTSIICIRRTSSSCFLWTDPDVNFRAFSLPYSAFYPTRRMRD